MISTNHSFNNHYDIIVIGVGAMGSAALYELAKRGKKVLAIERYDIPHTMGSYHGLTRIIRLAYMEHPSYVPLLHRAYELWQDTQLKAGQQLLHITGGIDASYEQDRVFQGSLKACQQFHLQHQVYSPSELKKRFPAFELPDGMMANYQPNGGFLLSENCILAHVNLALALGAEVHGREQVIDWEPHGDGVKVSTDRGTYTADKLVVTAGAWSSKLLEPLQGEQAVPERQVLIWTQPRKPALFSMGNLPVWIIEDKEAMYYGFPVYGMPGFKYGRMRHLRQNIDPDDWDRECHPEDEQLLRRFGEQVFPESGGPTLSMKSCIFTNSKDQDFVVDHHPDYPQLVFAAGFSGHGFKFASVIGEVLAQMACDQPVPLDIDLFRLDRPGIQ